MALLPQHREEDSVSIILIQDAVTLRGLQNAHVAVLSEDLASKNMVSPYPKISYDDMVRMIFESDRVIAL